MNTNKAMKISRDAFFEAFKDEMHEGVFQLSSDEFLDEDGFKKTIRDEVVSPASKWPGAYQESIREIAIVVIWAEFFGFGMDYPGYKKFCDLIGEMSEGKLWVEPCTEMLWMVRVW